MEQTLGKIVINGAVFEAIDFIIKAIAWIIVMVQQMEILGNFQISIKASDIVLPGLDWANAV